MPSRNIAKASNLNCRHCHVYENMNIHVYRNMMVPPAPFPESTYCNNWIDALVFDLYGLAAAERAIVLGKEK